MTLTHPWMLALLIVLPWVWHMHARSRVPAPVSRRIWRTVIAALLIASAAGVAIAAGKAPLVVVAAVDRSASIPAAVQRRASSRLQGLAETMRRGDRLGVVAFGADAAVERRPLTAPVASAAAAIVDDGATDIGGALRRARAVVPEGSSARILLMSDGRETTGDAMREALDARAAGVAIDVVPLSPAVADLRLHIERVTASEHVSIDEPFAVGVEVAGPPASAGEVTVFRDDSPIASRHVVVADDGTIGITVEERRTQTGAYVYTAAIQPDAAAPEDDEGSGTRGAVVDVGGSPRVLYVSNGAETLAPVLSSAGFGLTHVPPPAITATAGALSRFAAVVLEDVAEDQLPESTMTALASYVEDGGGLMVLGGEGSLPPGSFSTGPLARVLPIDLRPRAGQHAPSIALVVAFDKSGSMDDRSGGVPKIELAREAVMRVLDVVPATDSVGVIAFDSRPTPVAPLAPGQDRRALATRLDAIAAGGATSIAPAMAAALDALRGPLGAAASRREVLLVSDGRTSDDDAARLRSLLKDTGVTVSVAAIGATANRALLEQVAAMSGGRAYFPGDDRDLPRIVAREAARAAGGGIVDTPFVPHAGAHPVLAGIDATSLPALGGYVISAAKPTADAIVASSFDDPILCGWRAGLGRVVVFTADLGSRWSAPLRQWHDYSRLFQQTMRWTARGNEDAALHAAIVDTTRGPRLRLDAESNANPLILGDAHATIRPPRGGSSVVVLDAVGPGRYEAPLPTSVAGPYTVDVTALDRATGLERRLTRTIYWSAERERSAVGADAAFLTRIATASGGRVLSNSDSPFAGARTTAYADASAWTAVAALVMFLLDLAAPLYVRRRTHPLEDDHMDAHSKILSRLVAAVALTLLASTAPALAQVTTGTIVGTIVDSQGQPIPRAGVRILDPLRGVTRTGVADATGRYRFGELPPAVYAVTASAAGFHAVTQPEVAVQVDSISRVDLQLPLDSVTENVVVTAPARSVQTPVGLGTVLDRQKIESLPLNGRHFLQLSLLTPGVEDPVEASELSSRGGVAMHANGAREEFNDFLLDGVDNTDPYVNRYVVQPSVDSVQEFKVATNSYSAEYGRNAGGQVNVITRRGTSELHGFVDEYFRNRVLDARNYFEGNATQPFNRNEFGGGVGGPIVRDRTFFFGTVNVLREREGLSRLATVPTDAQRLGDLSSLPMPVFNPFTGKPFAGNIIPASMISPLARQVLGLFPTANNNGPANFLGQPVAQNDQTQVDVRVDHQLSSSSGLTFRYSDGLQHLLEPYAEGTAVVAGYGDLVDDHTWNGMAQHQQIFSHATNTLRFGANGFSRDVLTQNHDTNAGAAWGVNWLNVPAGSYGYPLIKVAGYSDVGDAYTLPLVRNTRTYQVADDLAIDRGNHLVKVGGEMRHLRLDSRLDLFSRGQLSFTGAITGSGLGDLLLGLPTLGLQSQADNPIFMRTNAYSAYVQDDWRIGQNLTLNLGARYEYVAPPTDERNGMSTFNLSTGQIQQVGTGGLSRSGLTPDRNNLAPRLGASWRLTPSTIVRAGYGVFYDSSMFVVNSAQYFNPPQFNLRVFFPSARGLLTLADPFPLNGGFTPPATVTTLSPDIVNGYLQHWNVAVQRDVENVGTITAAYAGSKGSNLIRSSDINQPAPGPGDLQARRPYPAFSNIVLIDSNGRSRFDSLQLTLDRPLSRGMSLSASYTLAKSMDDQSAFLGTPTDTNFPQNSHNVAAEWAPSSYDVRHRFTLSYIVALPSGNRWTRDTQVQGIVIARSGQPFTPVLQFDNSNTGNTGGVTAGSDRPNVVGNPVLANPTPDEWFNTAALGVPAKYTFGDAGRNSLRGPGFATFDVAVSRDVRLSRGTMTVGLQVFNLFNRTNFGMPGNVIDLTSTFGRILSAGAPRQAQLVARIGF